MKKSVIAISLLACSTGALVQAAPAVPQPGSDLNQAPKPAPRIENQLPGTQNNKKKELRFTLKKIIVEQPETHFSDKKLTAIANKAVGHEINVRDLENVLSELAFYARHHGYPAAYAYVPEQKAKGGVLRVRMALGRYGQIKIDNEASKGAEHRAKGLIAGLKPGDVIEERSLETRLFNVNEMYGVNARGTLEPGSQEGTSNLIVHMRPGRRQTVTLYSDNYGSRSSGRYRYGVQAGFMGLGDTSGRLTVGGLISNNHLHNYNVGWDMMTGHSGTNIGIRHSRMDYELGSNLADFGARGIANTTSLFGTTPIWRAARSSLAVNYGFDYRDITDEMRTVGIRVDKHSHAFHIGLDGVVRNGKGLAIHKQLTVYTGNVSADSDWGHRMGKAAGTLGHFTKGVLDLAALQKLGHSCDLLVKFQGQKASKNLDSSEQIYLGGARGVRAYPSGEAAGDEGYLSTVELHYRTPLRGVMLRTYYDLGHVRLSKDSQRGGETLQGWGVGLTWQHPSRYFARLDYARRIGLPDNPSKDAHSKQRIWFMAGKTW
ncbi:ShlB/FhaC/HecB family hemolysin secretion/activation protein [Selenomonas ruminantium]|uniref:Hemolysin activation/secretion protein n=1 Tax=Selenomonas ruminantium TaxID=971 RepID=A0A1H0UUT8_SELRU|nr:ShlB/FhaC/HecB family hemolysin secretion/activation protein [Selenomonas ruminantium]SDP69861.1 Hemolysin activation/secretion protein [Selenomonas ruminantium]